MSDGILNDALFAKLAGWQVVKHARNLLAAGRVQNSEWHPPLLSGMVQEGNTTYRAGLKIKSSTDADNLCTCREARQRGMICAHSIAVGLHQLAGNKAPTPQAQVGQKRMSQAPAQSLRRTPVGEEGEPLELFFILPPNLAQAVAKGTVMVCVEGKWSRGRMPLNAIPKDTPFTLSSQDGRLLDALDILAEGEVPAMVMLTASQFAELLPMLVNHPGVTLGRASALQIEAEPLKISLRAALDAKGEILITLTTPLPDGMIRAAYPWVLEGHKMKRLGVPTFLQGICNGPLRITRAQVPRFLNIEWPTLVSQCQVTANFTPADFVLETAQPRFKLHLAGSLTMVEARLECFYDAMRVFPGIVAGDESAWIADPGSPVRYGTRNLDAERAAVARLLQAGFSGPDPRGNYVVKGQNPVLNFFARDYPHVQREWSVTLEERLERTTNQNIERIEPRFHISSSGEQWFDLNVSYNSTSGETLPAADVQRLILSGQSHTRLKNGKFALMDTGAVEEFQEVLIDCAPRQHAQGYRLQNAQAGFLNAAIQGGNGWQVLAPAGWKERVALQGGDMKPGVPPLGDMEDVLRPYQKEGVAWLQFLRANGFCGILADEMGLGKTLQALAFLRLQRATATSPELIVCPTSLVFNWVSEARKFTPGLSVLALHGPQRRESFAQISKHDLVITSYAVLRRDAELYRGMEFETVVLDEAQHIKNRQTQNAQAVKSIRANHRLVLTGTPLENSVLDLWSIFDFLMPGYLGQPADFRERYEQPIIRDRNAAVQARLAKRLRPFMLRRLKRDVAGDLPEKIEQVTYCELNDRQRSLYQQVLDASRKEIHEAVDTNGLAKSRMVILTALLRLRQICCDMRLLGDKLENASTETSGKVELFGELLEEVIDGGHRVLVFSQFTTMLGLLRESLEAQKIAYCYLDGSTRDRAEAVDRFQRDPAIPVFLISLKAGGVGLNLTGADTVIHFDPWWNPAVEAQATDRAHRIGQKKVVTSYKLITRGTVEEKILNLQNRKRGLIQEMIEGEEQFSAALDWTEINELLSE